MLELLSGKGTRGNGLTGQQQLFCFKLTQKSVIAPNQAFHCIFKIFFEKLFKKMNLSEKNVVGKTPAISNGKVEVVPSNLYMLFLCFYFHIKNYSLN